MYSVRYIQILNVNYFILKIMMGIYPHVLGPSAELELLMRKLCLQPRRGVLKFQFSFVAIGSKVGIYCYFFTIKFKY